VTDYFTDDTRPLVPQHASAAVIILDDGRYLMQLRDQKPGLFYPGHWGLFGGALDPGETSEAAVRRELEEEIGLTGCDPKPLTHFTFQMNSFGTISRFFFEVSVPESRLADLALTEGSGMGAFYPADILTKPRVVPYDSFAIWLHANRARLS
jgi:8-oxo-dGTP pyrophosphatase MutT (NUDIX family)